jgi:hypothetical protein
MNTNVFALPGTPITALASASNCRFYISGPLKLQLFPSLPLGERRGKTSNFMGPEQ